LREKGAGRSGVAAPGSAALPLGGRAFALGSGRGAPWESRRRRPGMREEEVLAGGEGDGESEERDSQEREEAK
jgi:hypothetical protein